MAKNNGRVVVITGGNSGIGFVVARKFVASGDRVIILGRDQDKLKKAAVELSKHGFCGHYQVYVEKYPLVRTVVAKILKEYRQIDVLVNAAGILGPVGALHTNSVDEWHRVLEINLWGTMHMMHAVLPGMLTRKAGRIINFSGGGAVQAFPNFSAYAASKAAVVRLTENAAVEYAGTGVYINAIAPGAINTQFLEAVLKAGKKKAGAYYEKALRQKASGGDSASKAAELIFFLASASVHISGKLISAQWDSWQKFSKQKQKTIQNSSLFTLRRIDNMFFQEMPASSKKGKIQK